jgi:hypothetical protein
MHSVLIDSPLADSQVPLPGELQFVVPPLEETATIPGAGSPLSDSLPAAAK